MTNKIAFFYCVGTSYLFNWMGKGFNLDLPFIPKPVNQAVVAGLNGKTAVTDGSPQQDPFPSFLNSEIWQAEKIDYDPSMFPMNYTLGNGVAKVIARINALPIGQKFAIGGYSQGAAVISSVYNELRSGSLTARYNDFLGGVCFGNPRRQINYRGAVGGSWSGSYNTAGSNTGGHGSFPTTGTYARLTNCDPNNWLEFAAPGDIFTSVGDTIVDQNWVTGNGFVSTLGPAEFVNALAGLPFVLADSLATMNFGNTALTLTDAAGTVFNWLGGNGHTVYPFSPPEGNPDGTLTSYQIALKWLEAKAAAYAVAPVIIPPTSSTVGWSTTLLPPAA